MKKTWFKMQLHDKFAFRSTIWSLTLLLHRLFQTMHFLMQHFYEETYFEPQLYHAVTYSEPQLSNKTLFWFQNHANIILIVIFKQKINVEWFMEISRLHCCLTFQSCKKGRPEGKTCFPTPFFSCYALFLIESIFWINLERTFQK